MAAQATSGSVSATKKLGISAPGEALIPANYSEDFTLTLLGDKAEKPYVINFIYKIAVADKAQMSAAQSEVIQSFTSATSFAIDDSMVPEKVADKVIQLFASAPSKFPRQVAYTCTLQSRKIVQLPKEDGKE